MNEQLSFFETPKPSGPYLKLVLAIFPDPYTAQRIREFGKSLRKMHGLMGNLRPAAHLHVSLPIPRRIVHPPETAIQRIDRACKAVASIMSPFEIKFDRVVSFRGSRAIVLLNDHHESDGILSLYRLLCAEFAKLGSASASKFEPHLTILYDQQEMTPKAITPVGWQVKEIVLVLSEVGATKYHPLGCWAFGE